MLTNITNYVKLFCLADDFQDHIPDILVRYDFELIDHSSIIELMFKQSIIVLFSIAQIFRFEISFKQLQ